MTALICMGAGRLGSGPHPILAFVKCPKCQFEQERQTTECLRCGVIFAKYVSIEKAADSQTSELSFERPALLEDRQDSRREWIQRAVALPCALIAARLAVAAAPGAVRLLSMWVHEIGHATAAWLSGYPAMPGPWFTSVSDDRSIALTILLVGSLGFLGFRGWQQQRWLWVGIAASLAAAVLYCTGRLYSDQAQQFIVFGGDAGCFVVGSILMASFYARKDGTLRQNSLRWGFLVIGALAFMDAFATWSGGLERVPLGENENGLSDPSVLTELYGWSMPLLRARYYRLAMFCLMVLGGVYVAGLIRAFSSHEAVADRVPSRAAGTPSPPA